MGSALAFFARRINTRFLAGALGFSAGVMIYVSLVEIFVKARASLSAHHGERSGYWITVVSFFIGIALIAVIDRLVPSFENPHELEHVNRTEENNMRGKDQRLLRMGLFSALAIAIHNFPEGLATFVGALKNPALGISIAAAIAIHNIPEGIAVSVALFYGTGERKKAFLYSFFSGLAEPVGALVGWLVLKPFMGPVVFGVLFAAVGGIMVFISLDQLLPAAEKYGFHHLSVYGLISGMAVMALSLLLSL